MSRHDAPGWVVPVMRFGYATRGVTYVLIGSLALLAAWTGGEAEGAKGALRQLKDQPWGQPMLWAAALGLLAYAVWRLVDAWLDLEDYGLDLKGAVARAGLVATGLIHLALGLSTLRMALGDGGDGGGTVSLASKLLAMPYGAAIVMAAGAVTVGAGIYYGYKGLAETYKQHLRRTALTERLDPAVKAGLVAHGVVIALIGGFLFFAGYSTDPGQAGGIGQAFETVRGQPFGQLLLGLLGAGMLGFAVYCFVEAAYRVIPRVSGNDVPTLASRAKAKVGAAAARLT